MLLMAFAMLSIDIGRMIMIKSELQAFTDAAAMNAALQLDGSSQGVATLAPPPPSWPPDRMP